MCRAITNVLRDSNIGQHVNAQAFYALLSNNFQVFMTPNGFDLVPIWKSLSAQVDDQSNLPDLFLAFQENLATHGIDAILPPELNNMSSQERSVALDEALHTNSETNEEAAVTEEIPPRDTNSITSEMPALGSGDLIPLSDKTNNQEIVRQEIIQYVIDTLKNTSINRQTNLSQIAFLIHQHFDALFDGKNLNFEPLIASLSDIPGYNHQEIYPGLIQLRKQLEDMDISLIIPDLGISADEGAALITKAAQHRKKTQQQYGAPSPPPSTPTPETKAKPRSRTAYRLKRYGLVSRNPVFWQNLRLAILAFTFVVTLSMVWIFRPNRPLPSTAYALPLKSASLRAGIFVGNLDDEAWYILPPTKRRVLVKRFGEVLHNNGFATNAMVIDSRGRRVFQTSASGEILPSKFALESPDGIKLPAPNKKRDPLDIAKDISRYRSAD